MLRYALSIWILLMMIIMNDDDNKFNNLIFEHTWHWCIGFLPIAEGESGVWAVGINGQGQVRPHQLAQSYLVIVFSRQAFATTLKQTDPAASTLWLWLFWLVGSASTLVSGTTSQLLCSSAVSACPLRNRLRVRVLAVSDTDPMFTEPIELLGSLRGSLGTYGSTQRMC